MINKPLPVPVLSIVLIVALLGASGCRKPDDGPGAAARFSATINGEIFQPTKVESHAQNGLFVITGLMPKAADTFQLQLLIRDTINVHSKLTFKNNEATLYHINTKGSPTYSSLAWYAHGEITFTSVDKSNKKLAGQFSGVIYIHGAPADSLVITDGQFNTTYK
jgi:hypothetical protein